MESNKTSDFSIGKVVKISRKFFEGANKSHDWEHTLRVVKLCDHIGAKEGTDMDVLLTAAYLHDIGRPLQDMSNGSVCHAEKGACLAQPFIKELDLSDEQKENIIHCIRAHRFRGGNVPETIEAKTLFDADKLDAIGAVGIARSFLFAGEIGAKLHNPDINIEDTKPYSIEDTGYREYRVKLCRIKDRMLTKEGKRMALLRHAFMEDFFAQFVNEHEGKR